MASAVSATASRLARRVLRQPTQHSSTSRLITTLARADSHHFSPSLALSSRHSPCPSLLLPSLLPFPHCSPSYRSFASPAKRPIPTLNATLRRFYFLVHPDLFHSHPHHRAINEESMQHFLGFITAMKQTNSEQPWPLAQHTNLTFYIRRKPADNINTSLSFIQHNEQQQQHNSNRANSSSNRARRKPQPSITDGDFHVLRLTLSTNGGSCKSLVEKQLRHLFAMLGLPEEFKWDDEYWQTKPPVKKGDGESDGEDGEWEYA